MCKKQTSVSQSSTEAEIISGLPHAVVKQAENFRVRELVKMIESRTHRQDLQPSNAYNPFSEKSKKMIRDMGNAELFK